MSYGALFDYAQKHQLDLEISTPVQECPSDPFGWVAYEYTGDIYVTIGDNHYHEFRAGDVQRAYVAVWERMRKDLGL